MNSVQPLNGIQQEGHEVRFVQNNMDEVTVKDVWTKFFFDKKNLLRFGILLQIESGEMVLYQELKDYSEYKNTLKDLHQAKSHNTVIKIPKKSAVLVRPLEKWHGFRKV